MHFEHTEKTKNLMNLISKFIEDKPASDLIRDVSEDMFR